MNNLIRRALSDENGTTLTEFVICLPIFITTFVAIVNLGEWGIESTAVRMQAQKAMWADAIPVTYDTAAVHMSPSLGGGDAVVNLTSAASATSEGARTAGYVYEDGVMGIGLGLGGHFGESYARVLPARLHPEFEVDPVHMRPSDVTSQPYPRKVIDDAVTDFDRGRGGNIMDIITEVIGSTGAFQSVGAGIRYGEAFGDATRDVRLSRAANTEVSWYNDTLVAPNPLQGFWENKATFGIAWVLAQTQDNYYNLFVFGDGDGLSSSGTSSSSSNAPGGVPSPGDITEEYSEEEGTRDGRVGDAEEELAEQQAEEEGD